MDQLMVSAARRVGAAETPLREIAKYRDWLQDGLRTLGETARNTGGHPAVPPVAVPSPSRLPKVRDRIVRDIQRTYDQHGDDAVFQQGGAQRSIRHLAAAHLLWVSADMCAVTTAATSTLPADTVLDHTLLPGECGFMWFETPVVQTAGMAGSGDMVTIRIHALSWGPGPSGLQVGGYTTYQEAGESVATFFREKNPEGWPLGCDVGPLREASRRNVYHLLGAYPIIGTVDIPTGVAIGDLPHIGNQAVERSFATAVHLMAQPLLVEHTPHPVDGHTRRDYRQAKRPDPKVTLVELRHPTYTGGSDATERTYHHRWIVQGHWRNQAYGPGRTGRRPVWIHAYQKGPEGAPLLLTEKVGVWRR